MQSGTALAVFLGSWKLMSARWVFPAWERDRKAPAVIEVERRPKTAADGMLKNAQRFKQEMVAREEMPWPLWPAAKQKNFQTASCNTKD